METVPCRACKLPLALDERVCPGCHHPRTQPEIDWDTAAASEERERRRRARPWLLLRLAAVAGLAALSWQRRAQIKEKLIALRARYTEEMQRIQKPRVPAAAATAELARPAAPEAALPPGTPASPSKRKARPPAEPAASSGLRRFYGLVYDLETAAPVPGAFVRLRSSASGRETTTSTDYEGHYLIAFPSNETSPLISVEAPGYRRGQLEERDPALLGLPGPQRRSVIAQTADSELEPALVSFALSQDVVRLDLALLPLPKR